MAFESQEAELGMLLGHMQRAPEDWFELHEQVRQMLNDLKASGMSPPYDLVRFEHELDAACAADADAKRRRAHVDELIRLRAAGGNGQAPP